MENELPKTDLAVTKDDSISQAYMNEGSFESAQRMAKALSSSNLVPAAYQNNIPNTMIALEMASRIKVSPIMVMQNLNVIQGKPSWSSAFIITIINTCGKFEGSLKYRMEGESMERKCTAYIKDLSGEILESPTITMKMAADEGWLTKGGSKWKSMPDLMLRYRAAAFFGRLYCPEILMGMQTQEEVCDVSGTGKTTLNKNQMDAIMKSISEGRINEAKEVLSAVEIDEKQKESIETEIANQLTLALNENPAD